MIWRSASAKASVESKDPSCGLLGHTSGNRQDRTFLGLHDCLICCLTCPVKASDAQDNLVVKYTLLFDHTGKAAEKLGQDNTRIASGSAERPLGDCL